MAKLDIFDITDCDLYSIEMNDGRKVIHVNGYFYDACGDEEKPIRHVEACWCYVDIEELVQVEDRQDAVDEAFSYCKQYIADLTNEEAQEQLDHYFNGNPPSRLCYSDITLDTPCGDYINY